MIECLSLKRLPFFATFRHNAPETTTLTYTGGNVGKPVTNNEGGRKVETAPPLPNEPVRRFSDLAGNGDDARLSVEACPLNERPDTPSGEIGPYNALSLAGRALTLSASLSPDYCQAYLAGLEDLVALRSLPDGKRSSRR